MSDTEETYIIANSKRTHLEDGLSFLKKRFNSLLIQRFQHIEIESQHIY